MVFETNAPKSTYNTSVYEINDQRVQLHQLNKICRTYRPLGLLNTTTNLCGGRLESNNVSLLSKKQPIH
jgi:hypothetical protein